MRILQLLFAIVVILLLQDAPAKGFSDSQLCRNNHGHCRRLCFHMETWSGSCLNGRLRCCRVSIKQPFSNPKLSMPRTAEQDPSPSLGGP
uniref:Avian beta-defensin 13 n=1 Tax=Coturnix japonica TaxID=93934 RepID=A0A7I6P9S2_COTJA|nr:avian beta-defensin 13 [Coturnix japonica]